MAKRLAPPAGTFEPLRAPHAPLVRELIAAHLPALHRRLRAEHIERLAARVLVMERSPVPLVELLALLFVSGSSTTPLGCVTLAPLPSSSVDELLQAARASTEAMAAQVLVVIMNPPNNSRR